MKSGSLNNNIGISSQRNAIKSRYTERRTMTWKKSFEILTTKKTQPVLDKIKLIEDRWRTMDLWRIVKLMNPSPLMKFDQEDPPQRNKPEHKTDEFLRRSIILCCIFEDLSKKFGWKVGDTLDIKKDICDVVGKLILEVDEHDKSSMLDCMQCAIMNLQANGNEQYEYKFRSLLITKNEYNDLNLACILLEQMVLDNKDNNDSWMRIVCSHFTDWVVQLIIEPDYREDVRWNLKYLMKLESLWSVADIYSLIRKRHAVVPTQTGHLPSTLAKNSKILLFHRQWMLVSVATMKLTDWKAFSTAEMKNTFMCSDSDLCYNEYDIKKSLYQVFNELEDDKVGQEKKKLYQTNYRKTLEQNWRNTTKELNLNKHDFVIAKLISKAALNKNLNEFEIQNRSMVSTC